MYIEIKSKHKIKIYTLGCAWPKSELNLLANQFLRQGIATSKTEWSMLSMLRV